MENEKFNFEFKLDNLQGLNSYSHITNFQFSLENLFLNKSKINVVNSGTSAIHLALILLGVKSEDEVLCQSFTFAATAFPILYQNATPIFIDSEKETWNICPVILEEAIKDRIIKGKKPKAIIIVHIYGMPAKLDEILKVSNKYNIPLIEDAAEALGSEYKNQKCGSFGTYGILSFNDNKIITTFGGGALISKLDDDKRKAINISNQSKDSVNYYRHSKVGYNYRMHPISAKMGVEQIQNLDKNILKKRKIHNFYKDFFNPINGITIFEEQNSNSKSNYWYTCILIDKDVTGFSVKDLLVQFEKDNIEIRHLMYPLHKQPIFKNYKFYGTNISENLFRDGLCLPSGSNLTNSDLQRISESINKLL